MKILLSQEKKLAAMHRHIVTLHKELDNLKAEISHLKTNNISVHHHEAKIADELTKQEVKPQASKESAKDFSTIQPLATAQPHHKKTIKEIILHEVQHKQRSLKDLKHAIVDKQNLCSKASFYRYIKELRETNSISQITINNTEFVAGKVIEEKK